MPAPQMQLPWRNKVYTYTPDVIRFRPDTRFDTDMPICGADTESTIREGTGIIGENGEEIPPVYECQCVTFATPKRKGIRWIQPNECALIPLIEEILKDIRPIYDHKTTLFIYVHNLGYDISQLFKWRPDLMSFARSGVYQSGKSIHETEKKGRVKGEYFIGRIGERNVYLKNQALFIGTAPHFSLRCYKSKEDYVTLTFLDTGSFFRGALKKIAEDLKLQVQKGERQEDLGRKDYRTVDDADPAKKEFAEYAIDDAEVVRLVGMEIIKLHDQAGFTKIRVSSPGFAHSYFTKTLGELDTVIFTGSYQEADMRLILDTYAGGRTGGLWHGPIDNVYVFDFASSYPCAMTSLPSFTPTMKYRRMSGRELEWDYVWQWLKDCPHAFLRVDGEEMDPKYPALIKEKNGRLTPVFGKFYNLATTGPEIYGGVMSGTLRIDKVHEAVFCFDTEVVPSPFKLFAEEAYKLKQREEKDSIPYIMAKLLLNSAYGKWIQATKAQLVGTDGGEFVCDYPEDREADFARLYLETYATAQELSDDPDYIWSCLEHIQQMAWEDAEARNMPLLAKPLERMDLTEKEFAKSAIPAAASLVTGIARARLRALMKATEAVYWDTDSVFLHSPNLEKLHGQLALGSSWIHPALVPLRIGKELGELDLELENGSGWLAGTKRYYLTAQKGEKTKIKQAIHGITHLPKDQALSAIEALATGKNFSYDTKPAPLKPKQARDSKVGLFTSRKVNPEYHLDPRLDWRYEAGAYIGYMKTWEELDLIGYEKALEREQKEMDKQAEAMRITSRIKFHGFIRIPLRHEYRYMDYMELPAEIKKKYFRKKGLPLDEMAAELHVSTNELWEELQA